MKGIRWMFVLKMAFQILLGIVLLAGLLGIVLIFLALALLAGLAGVG
jgi:hypothetical protein